MLSAKSSWPPKLKRDIRIGGGGRAGSQTGSAGALLDDEGGRVSDVTLAVSDLDGAMSITEDVSKLPTQHDMR